MAKSRTRKPVKPLPPAATVTDAVEELTKERDRLLVQVADLEARPDPSTEDADRLSAENKEFSLKVETLEKAHRDLIKKTVKPLLEKVENYEAAALNRQEATVKAQKVAESEEAIRVAKMESTTEKLLTVTCMALNDALGAKVVETLDMSEWSFAEHKAARLWAVNKSRPCPGVLKAVL